MLPPARDPFPHLDKDQLEFMERHSNTKKGTDREAVILRTIRPFAQGFVSKLHAHLNHFYHQRRLFWQHKELAFIKVTFHTRFCFVRPTAEYEQRVTPFVLLSTVGTIAKFCAVWVGAGRAF